VRTTCPHCARPARRETDTMDTFVESSWYFLRFVSPDRADVAFDLDEARRWMPVDQYVGGVTHAILHLLYARFITKVLYDLDLVHVTEPFTRLLNQGMVIMNGRAMSKSGGNLVKLSDQLTEHGVDAIRLTMAFAGPPEDDIDWADVSAAGSARFLARAWRLAGDVRSAPGADATTGDVALRRVTHRTLHDVAELVEGFKFNVAVARVMELVNATRKAIDAGPGGADPAVREATEAVAVVLSLFSPYTAEDMWARLGHDPAVALAGWPAVDEALLVEETVTAVVQVAGKVRDRLEVPPSIAADDLRSAALASAAVQKALDGRDVRTVVVRATARSSSSACIAVAEPSCPAGTAVVVPPSSTRYPSAMACSCVSSVGETARSTASDAFAPVIEPSARSCEARTPPGASSLWSSVDVKTPWGSRVIGCSSTHVHDSERGSSGRRTRKTTGVRSAASEVKPLRRSTFNGYTPDWAVEIPAESSWNVIVNSRSPFAASVPSRGSVSAAIGNPVSWMSDASNAVRDIRRP